MLAAFLELIQTVEDELGTAATLRGIELPDVAYRTVLAAAAKRVGGDPAAEWSTPTTAAPITVATIARIVERYRALEWELPVAIATLWAWCVDGRWPCGFAKKLGKAAVARSTVP